jgi:hypothetical protein
MRYRVLGAVGTALLLGIFEGPSQSLNFVLLLPGADFALGLA